MTWKDLATQAAEHEQVLTRDDGAPGDADYLDAVIAKIRATPETGMRALLEETELKLTGA